MSARFQPRDEASQFSSYASRFGAMYVEYAWTSLEYDTEDETCIEEQRATDYEQQQHWRRAGGGDAHELRDIWQPPR